MHVVTKTRGQRVFICLLLLWPVGALAGEGAYRKSQFYRGITAHHVVTHFLQADLDGDGSDEVLVCYREPEDAVDQRGGVLILTGGPKQFQVGWHVMFENAFPEKVKADGKALTFHLVQKTTGEDKKIVRTLVKGKDFFFRDEDGNPFAKVKVSASSTLRKDGIEPANVFDRDLKSGWAEGGDGTGVDETVTLEFPEPVDLAMIGVLHGNFRSKRYWLDNNRLHRAEVTVETGADRYDTESEVDFGQDLGLGLYGDRVELSFTNRPVMRYFRLDKRDVLSLELKITSVLLGEKNDDAYVAEIDLVEMIPSWFVLGKKKPEASGKKKEEDPGKEEEEDDWTEDDF